MNDSTPWFAKYVAGGVGVAAFMVLILTGKVDGTWGAGGIAAIITAFIGGSALLGSAQAKARAALASPPANPSAKEAAK